MKQLRQRTRPDAVAPDVRTSRRSAGRLTYFVLLAGLAVLILNHFFSEMVYFHSEGIVVQNSVAKEAHITARVEDLFVKPGDWVDVGTPLMRIDSLNARIQLADFAFQLANMANLRLERRQIRNDIQNQLPAAQEKLVLEQEQLKILTEMTAKGLTTAKKLLESKSLVLDYKHEVQRLESRLDGLNENDFPFEQAENQYQAAMSSFGDGLIFANVSGEIGKDVRSVGEVLTVGESFLEIHIGRKFVLAYLPDSYLFPIRAGAMVRVTGDHAVSEGRIEALLPFSDILPAEFRNSLRPSGRNRLARISILEPKKFVYHQGVDVQLLETFSGVFSWWERFSGEWGGA